MWEIFHKQPLIAAENRMHAVNVTGLSEISPKLHDKLSKLTSHLVYVASSNNAHIWINSDVWLSFSHKLFRTCMAHYICISKMSRATEITISRAAVMWPMHVIRNKPSFVLYLISDYLLGGCIAVRWGRWGLSLDLTVCYDLPNVYFNSADCLNT